MIYLPGDNDIGGEGSDRLTEAKINRFNSNFPSESQQNIRGIHFLTVRVKNFFHATNIIHNHFD